MNSIKAVIAGDLPPALGSSARHADFVLPADGKSVGEVRHLVQEQLSTWDIGSDGRETAALVVSELFTNALVHTTSSLITCAVEATADQLVIEVTDDGGSNSTPTPRTAGLQDEGGRGLMLVKSLSDLWGVALSGDGRGRLVWAALRPARE
ncbi:ATP-binding protein [Streptomyces sp. NPDC058256]|uniref:ATP-binding protein n=1 Tax=Streptomyces sp. NPDC058256 TaxID=3346408 RepID=UPI0036EDCDE5